MFCWGKALEGQLGLGGIEEEHVVSPRFADTATLVPSKLKEIVCGWNHTAFLTVEGTVYTCGNNDFGQLGQDKSQTKPEFVSSLDTFMIKQVGCGQSHTIAVSDRGLVFSWGSNNHGQLGIESSTSNRHPLPRKIKHLSQMTVMQVACGANHTLALTDGGHIFSWGKNDHGQLGVGTRTDVSAPQHISSLNGVPFVHICAGGNHSFALSLSGALFGWGKNRFGQVGVSDDKDRFMPVLLKSLRTQHVKYVACGEDHTVVLTEDGGVFTFGSGRFGQLGHNSTNNENNPRKVFELMGSAVTQIACGRQHTLAFVRSSGKVYGFGLGTSGQLGISKKSNMNSPFPVWRSQRISTQAQSTSMDLTDAPEYEVVRLACGGDHCMVLAAKAAEGRDPEDFRRHDQSKHALMLGEQYVKELVKRVSLASSTADVIKIVELIFSSQACLNASFLDSKTHEMTNSRVHGIELSAARRAFGVLGSIPQKKILQLICSSVEQNLIPSMLHQSPPDIEALRVYILIPECDFLHKGSYLESISSRFGEAILKLSAEAQKVLRRWWLTLPSTYFARTMQVFQNCSRHLLQLPNPKSANDEVFRRKAALATCMTVLALLNEVNTASGDIVPFNQFYIPEIQDNVDIQADYFNWIQNDMGTGDYRFQQHRVQMFSFCRFPFVFDARAKTLLLQTDAIMQMQTAVDEANRTNAYGFFSGMLIDPVNPCLVIVVRRDNIVQDTLLQITKHGPYDLKKPLKVVFVGEEGVDAGGVRKEFFLLLLTEILDPKYGMFTYIEESHTIWFNELSFEENPMFLLVGVICGLAIYNSMIIDLRFPPVLYKRLLGRKPILDDFRSFQPSIARNLQYLLDYDEDDIHTTFGLNFQVVREKYGALEYIDLMGGGGEIPVTQENKQQYVDRYIDYYLNKSVEKQFEAFNTGFHRVCGGRILEFFHPQELMEMVVGCQEFDFKELEKVAEYKGEYYRNHLVIRNFWDVFHEFPVELKKKFLAFLTGSDRVPITGMKNMKIIIQPVAGGEHGNHLPVAHTCFNLLDLPRYPTKEMMKTKLSQAIEFSTGFGLA